MNMGGGRPMTVVAFKYITRGTGKADLVAGVNGVAGLNVHPAQMRVLGIQSARVLDYDLIPISRTGIGLNVGDLAVAGSHYRGTDWRGDIYSRMRAPAVVPEIPKGATSLSPRWIARIQPGMTSTGHTVSGDLCAGGAALCAGPSLSGDAGSAGVCSRLAISPVVGS